MNNSSSQSLAVLGVGVAVGLGAAKLLGSLIDGANPFQRLIDDHRKLLEILSEMEMTPVDEKARRAKQFLMLKRTLGKHALAEEDVVYPILHDFADAEEDVRHLFQEHAEMKIWLFELETLLRAGEDWTDRVRQLRELITVHARQEEEVEFPRLCEALGRRRAGKLSGLIKREEALMV